MAKGLDIIKILKLATEGENPEITDRIIRRIVQKYPSQAASLVRQNSLKDEFRDDFFTVTSASELTKKQKTLIENVILKKTGTKPKMTYLVNDDLLGGVVIRRGEMVIDNTLRNRVNQLTEFIKQTKLGAGVTNVG